MVVADIAKLSLREKLQVMGAIWEDLRGLVDGIEIPEEHRRILDSRRARVESGDATTLDWDKVNHSFGRA